MYKRILVPTDGSEITAKAVQTAVAMARLFGARIDALTVKKPFDYAGISEMAPVSPSDFQATQNRLAEQRLASIVEACAAAGVPHTVTAVEADRPHEAIIDHAQAAGCELIVMASHGRRGVSALLLGSETQKVLTHSKLPVLVVR